MKSKLTFLILIAALALMLAANIQAQTMNPPYLGQFPSVERLKADVRGVDAMETAAKQAGIFWQLHQLISLLAYSQRRTDRQFTTDEQRLIAEYRNAYYFALQPFEGKMSGADKPRWFELHTKYELDTWLRDEVMKKYFAPELRRAVYVALKGVMPTESAPAGSTLVPTDAELATANAGANKANSAVSSPRPTAQVSAPGATSAEAYYEQGEKYWKATDYTKAIEAYKKAVALQPDYTNASVKLSLAYMASDQPANAVAVLQQAIRLRPDAEIAHYALGSTYNDLEQYEKAVPPLREAIRLSPNEPQASEKLGFAYFKLKRYPEAVAAFQQAVRLKPDFADAHLGLGMTYMAMGQKNQALQVYRTLLRVNKEMAQELYEEINKSK
jgi:tetratricopeptide (TPR) repeat protein